MEALSFKIVNFCTDQSSKFNNYRMSLIAFIGLLVYSNTFYSPFIFDDSANLVNNPVIMDLGLSGLKAAFHSRRAIGIITFQLNYFFSEWNVVWFHLTNIIIHIFASLSVYRLLQLLMATEYFSDKTDERFRQLPLPFFAALLFVVHPVQTQAVTYIVQRFASLATLFYLAAIISYLNARLHQVELRKLFTVRAVVWFCAAFFCVFLAFYTKETAYTLPLAIMLVELLFFRCTPKKIFIVFSVSATAVIAVLIKYASATQSLQSALSVIDEATRLQTTTTRLDYLFTQFRVIIRYISLILFPISQRVEYDYLLLRNFSDWRVYCSFSLIILLMGGALWMVIKSRDAFPGLRIIAFGILWFFLGLSIESSFIPIIDLIFEHRLYLPSFGAFTAIAAALLMTIQSKELNSQKWLFGGILLVSGVLAIVTFNRNSVWKTEVSLWSDNVAKSPESARAWHHLGAAYINKRDAINSLKATVRSIELDRSSDDTWNNLGIAIDLLGVYKNRFNRTYEQFKEPESITYRNVNRWQGEVNNNLGLAYEILGNLSKAAENYRNAVGYNPSLGLAYYNLGIVSAKMGDASRYSEQVQILRLIDPILAERLQGRVEKR